MGDPDFSHLNWGLTAVAIVLSAGRYAIRCYNSRRLYWDDLAHLLALLVLISHGATNGLSLHAKADLANLKNAHPKPPPSEVLDRYHYNQRLSTVNNCFLYSVFWIVKVSFLLLYRLLFQTSAAFRRVWWVVLGFTLLTFWVPIAGVLATCDNAHTVAAYKACNSNSHARKTKLGYTCAINVFTDLLIMALPFWMIQDLKIDRSQKIGLGLIFSVAIVCVVLDIVRTIEAVVQNQALYTIIEINLVVIISCLPTYRALLTIFHRRKETRRPSRSSAWKSIEDGTGPRSQDRNSHLLKSMDGDNSKSDANVIHVRKDVAVSEGDRVSKEDRDPYLLDRLEVPGRPAQPPATSTFQTTAFT